MSYFNSIFQLPDFEALKAMQLFIKHHIEGLMIGMHQSPKSGFGIEFKEYRNYTPGDSLKQLDWKYFARTDHYMIKEAEMEKQHDFIFVLDNSLSMNFEYSKNSKFNWARTLIAALAYIANNQFDKYYIFNQDNPPQGFEEFLYRLIHLETEQNIELKDLKPHSQINNKNTVFLFTDGYGELSQLKSLLSDWSVASKEVMLIHLLFDNEENLDFEGQYFSFKDLESEAIVEINKNESKTEYVDRIAKWKAEIKQECVKNGIVYWQMNGKESFNKSIFQLLSHLNQSWV
ncbi:DUF58 domain-containing protein [Marivirga arenosa]|uniref:DUF58 domain-containing protein n=1 Tax=Marivirga arenosa TaxID=3059076 RepID=A0AA49GEK5_9BACT|nr:DUF58 domain-containing protein [Marivirga sp. BKB1-2]WKK80772.2 DUF58 domain-containing protein [Marivirga sp. BKB1-2]